MQNLAYIIFNRRKIIENNNNNIFKMRAGKKNSKNFVAFWT
jgi:hypothetical protein